MFFKNTKRWIVIFTLQFAKLNHPAAGSSFMFKVGYESGTSNCPVSIQRFFFPSDSWFQKKWGHNVSEFRQRFDSELTAGEGPKRLRNLYFLYLIELRALAKALPFFQQPSFQLYTGRPEEDQRHKRLLLHILQQARSVWGLMLTPQQGCC